MPEERFSDLEIPALGWGCLASGMTSCVTLGIISTLLFAAGIQVTKAAVESVPSSYRWLGLVLALVGNILAGYVTASTARHAKVLHTVVLAIILLLLGVGTLTVPSNTSGEGGFMIIGWVFTIPAMLVGAWWATRRFNKKGDE